MRRVVIGILAVLFVGCVALTGGLYFYGVPLFESLMEGAEEDVSLVMTEALEQSVSEILVSQTGESGELRLRVRDLTVNNAAVAGEVGWESGTSGTVVYGLDLWIADGRLFIGMGELPLYSGVPVVSRQRLELEDVRTHVESVFDAVLSAETFERVVETGMNDTLDAYGHVPTGVSLRDGELILTVASTHKAQRERQLR